MTCDEVRQLLDAHVDGELDAVTSLGVQQHLDACAGCSATVASLSAVGQSMQQSQKLYYRAPASLAPRIERVSHVNSSGSGRTHSSFWAGALAGAALAA